jgi:hypothetical protein
MARTSALGHWLKSSKGKGKTTCRKRWRPCHREGITQKTRVIGVKKVKRDGQIWMVRGGIWFGALGLSVGVDLAGEPFVAEVIDFRAHPYRLDF